MCNMFLYGLFSSLFNDDGKRKHKGDRVKLNHGTRKPRKVHFPCETSGCNNYYNVTYRDTNNKCNICRKKEKKERE